MHTKNLNLLGKQVLPILRRCMVSGYDADKRNGNMGEWLTGKEKQKHFQTVVSQKEKEIREDNKSMEWYVFAIRADNTFDLRSEYGYEQCNVSRGDFRLINGGKVW